MQSKHAKEISQFGKAKKSKDKKVCVKDLLMRFLSVQTVGHYHIRYRKLKQQKHSEGELREKESFF